MAAFLRSRRHLFFWMLAACLVLASSAPAHAQSQGKVTGVVTDAASGVPLPGASVYLEEAPMRGTTTDAEGRYFLLNVPPGTYTVVGSFVGFATVRSTEVQVFSGRTTTIDIALREEVFEGEEVVIMAERPIIVRDRTSSVSYIDQEAIDELPVREVGDLVRFQPGVVTSAGGGFHFRGGRSRETAYLIDGIPVQDVFFQGGGNTVDVEVQSVQELQVFTGTFDAELGGAQSGIVSVTTRDPGQKLEGSLRARTGGYFPGNDHVFIGGDQFNPLETHDISATLSGPITGENFGFFFNGRYAQETGALRGERRFNAEDGFRIDTYRRWYRDLYQPDDTRLIALDTARTPTGQIILDRDGNPLTFANGDGEVVDMEWSKNLTLNPKLVMRPFHGAKLSYGLLYNRSEGQGYSDVYRYAPDYRDTYHTSSFTHILNFTQAIGISKIVNLRGSYKHLTSESYAFDSIDDARILYGSASDDVTSFNLGATDNSVSERSEDQLILAGDFTWQINNSNEIKTGLFFRRNHFVIEDLDRDWVFAENPDSLFKEIAYPNARGFASFDDFYEAVQDLVPVLAPELEAYAEDNRFEQSPIEFAAYVQDKLEFGQRIVLKAGVRFELFDVNEQTLIDPRTPTDRIGRADNLTDTSAKTYLSPRLGLSFPVSSTGAFRVAYGHFVQMPAYNELLKNPLYEGINVGQLEGRSVGNPDLDPERTIKYEMGLQQQLNSFIGVDVNLFYKNVRNLLGTELLGTLDNIQYYRTVNRDYGLIRGATLSFVTRPVGMLLGSSFDVTYSNARGSSSNPDDVANVVVGGRSGELGEFFLERQIIPLNWDQTVTMNLTARVGEASNWSVGFISQLASGQPYTPAFLDPNLDFPENTFNNAERKPLLFTFDLNAEKNFKVGRAAYGVRLQVNNLFNALNERSVDAISGRSGQIIRLPVVQEDREMVLEQVGLFTKEESDLRPSWYSAPRQIVLGVSLNF